MMNDGVPTGRNTLKNPGAFEIKGLRAHLKVFLLKRFLITQFLKQNFLTYKTMYKKSTRVRKT